MKTLGSWFCVFALSGAMFTSADAQTQPLQIWPGVAPGSENWTQKEQVIENTPVGTVALNVVRPTLTAYLPNPKKATQTGIIIAPGGYCVALAISHEATTVARRLQNLGIAAFVLKYRTMEKTQPGIPKDLDMDQACKYGIADGIQALKVVRQHATAYGILPNRVGFIGFSAGGMIASGALLQADVSARPDFAALIYGAPFGQMPSIPAKLPPVFMAWAQDDAIAGDQVAKFYNALVASGNRPEAHIFSSGGHGFGLGLPGTTSDQWSSEFYRWLQTHGLTRARRAPAAL
ncbi:MAG: alpha/beta hydrolase [Candidatus Eremiobacteraeota bacterium]|nr:alpha/beta hydrolase [Candidatus Eremiobacteraeota bacterium]